MNRIAWIIFAIVQSVGEICFWSWEHFQSVGRWLFAIWFVIMMPGNFLGRLAIEMVFWTEHLSITQVRVIGSIAEIACNAVIWLLAATAFRLARNRLVSVKVKPRAEPGA